MDTLGGFTHSVEMGVAAPFMSYADYLQLEGAAEFRHEYVRGRVLAMAGGSVEHARLCLRFGSLLDTALTGRRCATFSSELRVRIEATGRSTYPDLSVVCESKKLAADDPHAIINPTVIVEVLSPSTEASDRGDEFAHYRRLDSLKEYVLVSQSAPLVEVYRREGAIWALRDYGPGQQVELASLDVTVDIDALYLDPLAP